MSKTWGGICTGLAIPTLQPLLTTLAYTLFGPITFSCVFALLIKPSIKALRFNNHFF